MSVAKAEQCIQDAEKKLSKGKLASLFGMSLLGRSKVCVSGSRNTIQDGLFC